MAIQLIYGKNWKQKSQKFYNKAKNGDLNMKICLISIANSSNRLKISYSKLSTKENRKNLKLIPCFVKMSGSRRI